jgi:hypothetical protein
VAVVGPVLVIGKSAVTYPVVAVDELLLVLGSGVVDVTRAVLEIDVLVAGLTTV